MGMLMLGPRDRLPRPAGVPGADRGVEAPLPALFLPFANPPPGLPGEVGLNGGLPAGKLACDPSRTVDALRVSSIGEVAPCDPARLSKLEKSVVRVMDGTRACFPPPLVDAESEALEVVRTRFASDTGERGAMDWDLNPKGEGDEVVDDFSATAGGSGDGRGDT